MSTALPMHCGFTCADVRGTVRFLTEVLGFECLSIGGPAVPGVLGRIIGVPGADATIAYVRLGELTLELLQYVAPPARAPVPVLQPNDVGFAHLAVAVEDVDGTVVAARGFGFAPVAPIVTVPSGPNAGNRVVYLRDPSGFTVELMTRR